MICSSLLRDKHYQIVYNAITVVSSHSISFEGFPLAMKVVYMFTANEYAEFVCIF